LDRTDVLWTTATALKRTAAGRGMLIDSHVNLHAPQFAEDQAESSTAPEPPGSG
jgi:hypothetical protein